MFQITVDIVVVTDQNKGHQTTFQIKENTIGQSNTEFPCDSLEALETKSGGKLALIE